MILSAQQILSGKKDRERGNTHRNREKETKRNEMNGIMAKRLSVYVYDLVIARHLLHFIQT